MDAVVKDKNASGSESFVANRYPVRFVLFDNFRDCYEFVSRQTSKSLFFQSIDLWLNPEFPDSIVTYSDLATQIVKYISESTTDSVITPFSELARFYNNKTSSEFHALISTIKAVESSQEGYDAHLRVYIPIVGLFGKMSKFSNDSQSTIWYLKSTDHQLNYNLVLTDGKTYGVKGLEEHYTVVHNVSEWLGVWKRSNISRTIICTSRSIFANAEYAQPDNAFDYTTCNNAYEFLTAGLGLHLDFIDYKKADEANWIRLANEIELNGFDFVKFFNAKFGIYDLADYKVFYQTWLNSPDSYSRWLLGAYYTYKFCDKGYICRTIKNCTSYTNAELVRQLLLSVFDLENQIEYLEERNYGLRLASKQSITLPENIQEEVYGKLIHTEELIGCKSALKYITATSDAEKRLLIEWITAGKISANEIADIYPDLYAYLSPSYGTQDVAKSWCLRYIDDYKLAKVTNCYTDAVEQTILSRNANEVAFNSWYNSFQTVKTIMVNRQDIDTYFWIDGLGLEWVPFIGEIIKERNSDGFFLNDVMIARATLPTTTDINKVDLQKLSGGTLPKDGDLDSDSHKIRPYPSYIISDMKKLRDSINKILDENPGKKIAIISDHGISYMPQLRSGLNLADISGEHSGRFATWNQGVAVSDDKYKILDDGRTICALRHESLTSKVKEGSGCHGGCSPEEVLVPIFIISDFPINSSYSVSQKTFELSPADPVMKFTISGLSNVDMPYIMYNGTRYNLSLVGNNIWHSEPLLLVPGQDKVCLTAVGVEHEYTIKIKLGTEENDLFDEF